jgi:L-ascorbate metabolism protein UlaG (beta-lactamase superfamily)
MYAWRGEYILVLLHGYFEMSELQTSIAPQIRALVVPQGHLAVWALGQQGYILKGGDRVVVIDPYLSNYVEEVGNIARQVPIPVDPAELDMVDLVLATHAHADHCDPRTLGPLLKASPSARLMTSYKGRDTLSEYGFDMARIQVPPVGRGVEVGNVLSVTAIPSAHYTQEPDSEGKPAYLGFIIALNGVTLYHCGDSVIYPGLLDELKMYGIDIACLPINGRDWFREQQDLVGNMDYREAAELAAAAGVKVLLPGHNDMFAGNRINPAYLLDYLQANHPRQRFHFLQAGELYYYAG